MKNFILILLLFCGFTITAQPTNNAQRVPFKPVISKDLPIDAVVADKRNFIGNDEIMRNTPIALLIDSTAGHKAYRTDSGRVYTAQLVHVKEVLRGQTFVKTGWVEVLHGGGVFRTDIPDDFYSESGDFGITPLSVREYSNQNYIIFARTTEKQEVGGIYKTDNPTLRTFAGLGRDGQWVMTWHFVNNNIPPVEQFGAGGLWGLSFKQPQEFIDYLAYYGIKFEFPELEKKSLIINTNGSIQKTNTSIENVNTENTNNKIIAAITSVFPLKLSAGVKQKITITGTGFGTEKYVWMKNADTYELKPKNAIIPLWIDSVFGFYFVNNKKIKLY